MPRIKLIVEYMGTHFVGWQRQKNGRSVQETLEKALAELLNIETELEAAGRTDAGVHAAGQVASFVTSQSLPMRAYTRGLNGILPADVSVRVAEEVAPDFDPRRWARGKRYRYRISNRPTRSALRGATHWELYAPLDMAAMQAAAPGLLGRQDFSAFRAADCQARHAVRELREVAVERAGEDELTVSVEGTAFLKHMVRNIVGSLVEVGRGRQPGTWVKAILEGRDRTLAGPTAPAHGLTLVEVFYGPRAAANPEEVEEDDGG